MKIVILTDGLPPSHNGGSEIAVACIAEHAAITGHDVHVIVAGGQSGNNRFTVHRVPTLAMRYAHGASYIPNAVALISAIRPDLVHVQGIYFAPAAVVAKLAIGTPYLLYERGSVYMNWYGKRLLYRTATKLAHRIVAQTQHQREELSKYTSKTVEVIPNGVDAGRFGVVSTSLACKEDARRRIGLPPTGDVALSVGRCRAEKNYGCLVETARAAYRDGRYNLLFVLVGDGPELQQLKRDARGLPNITFVGNVDNDSIPAYMAAANLLINTSHSEGFPMTILEAMASGLPIIAPKICGIPEIVIDGLNGMLVPPNSPLQALSAINCILSNPAMAARMSVRNREKASTYTWGNVVKELYR